MSGAPDLMSVLRAALDAVGASFAQGQDVPDREQRLDQAATQLERAVRASVQDSRGPGETSLMNTEITPRGLTHWSAEDLDRCEHGRHSVDPCFGCPGGQSTGNLYLTMIPEDPRRMMLSSDDGTVTIRIGTMVHGQPIVVPIIRARAGGS